MYLSLLQIKNFRCFDGNEHSITFKKGLNVLVGENDSGKSAIMDAIKLVLGTTDMNWYRVEQEDFYKEDATLEIKITCKLGLSSKVCKFFFYTSLRSLVRYRVLTEIPVMVETCL